MEFRCANRIAPDGTRSAVSHLGLCCLPICPIKGEPGLNELRRAASHFLGKGVGTRC